MSEWIAKQTGPFMHSGKYDQVFEMKQANGKVRHFRAVLYGAYNARGLIGSEKNGIAILDEDNMCVIVDELFKTDSGYNGPSRSQVEAFERITSGKMPWLDFAKMVNESPRKRDFADS